MVSKRLLRLRYLTLLLLINCANQKLEFQEQTRIMMDTFLTISVYDQDKSEARIQSAISAAFDTIAVIEKLTSNYSASSEVSMINLSSPNKISPTVARIVKESISIGKLTAGTFDISIWPVLKLWHFNSDSHAIPENTEILRQLGKVDYEKIELTDSTIKFIMNGMGLDIGGIAKGYAVDRAVEILQSFGMQELMVNAGGDLRAVSGPVTEGMRRVFIQHPRDKSTRWGYFHLDTGSVATSGDYERYFMADGKRYHHILDPATGYPVNQCISVTVTAETAIRADALSTAIFIMGPEKGLEFVERLDNVETIILFENAGKIEYVASHALKDKLNLIDDLND